MIECYRRATRRCRTVNQLNALHIALENRITPLELVALRDAQGPWFRLRTLLQSAWRLPFVALKQKDATSPRAQRDRWLRRLYRLYMQAAEPQPQAFRRRKLSRHLRLYSANASRHDKSLLICFVGSSQRPFLPVPVFLQHLDAARTDVLLVGYPRGKGHRHGLPELGGSFEESMDRLRVVADIDAYQRCVAIGTSGGGTPAVLAALRLGLSAALSAGGGSPTDRRWFEALGEDVGDLARRYATASTSLPRVVLAYGADAQKDVVAAQAFAGCIPAEQLPVDDDQSQVLHNLFSPLLRRRQLRSFLETSLMQAPP